jgi:hypothetical protein
VGAWAEKERTRLQSKLKKFKGSETEFLEKPKPMDPNWHCPQFLTFEYLALPAGKANCRKIFKLITGSGPGVKISSKANNKRGN